MARRVNSQLLNNIFVYREIMIIIYILYFPDQQLPQISPTFPPIFLRVQTRTPSFRHALNTRRVAFVRFVTDSSAQCSMRGHKRVMSVSRAFLVSSSSFSPDAHLSAVCTASTNNWHGRSIAKYSLDKLDRKKLPFVSIFKHDDDRSNSSLKFEKLFLY